MRKCSPFIMLILCMFLFNAQAFSQRTCGAHDVMLQQMKDNPRFAQKQKLIESHTKRIQETPMLKATTTITIPVHVIVVYANSTQNISDAQIQSQISVLNKDFRKQNSDWTSTPSEFYNLVADSEIEFTLQAIERHSNSTASWGTNNSVKTAYPPHSPNTHLNIWVCNIGGGILGYAQFPGGSSSTDGVVISPQYFGSADYNNGTFYLSAPFNKGRTGTHEVGHWLNLRHIWGDGACGASDYVDDTPDSDASNYGCPTHPDASCGSNDMFMNYMDYVDDACMYMFTQGQKARMRAIFEPGGPRASFVSGNPVTCNVNACNGNVNLSITCDNYPDETSWTLTNEAGAVIDQGSGYTTKGQTVSKSWNLAEGKYTFAIHDSYGDGICCSYGSGSYSLTDGCSITLKSGGNFGSSESVTFCVPGGGTVNTPPVADINGPYSGVTNSAVSFSSAGSNDPDGTISSYLWNFGDGSTSGSQNPSHTYTSAGTYNVSLTVTDNEGATDNATTSATITTVTQPVLTTITVTPGTASISVNATQQFSAQGYDQNNNPMSVSFNWSATGGTINANGLYTAGTTAGNYSVTATSGAVSGNASITITDGGTGGCTAPQYIANGGYSAGSRVQNNGVEYECKPYPYSGWCNGSAWAYEPGNGLYWADAWTVIGSCARIDNQRSVSALMLDNHHVSVYPNPIKTKATVYLALHNDADTYISLFSSSGQQVLELNNKILSKGEHKFELDLSDLPSGLYVYKIQIDGSIYSGNLLKN